VKVGIVVPFSWSFWGGVVDHADSQARHLHALGVDARIVIGNDPPGRLTRALHPRPGRHDPPPDYVIPVGRSVIAPANASLANVVLTPQAMRRIRQTFARERFDVVHVHEPLAPLLSAYAIAASESPVVVTCHSSGGRWYPWGSALWGRLLRDSIDHRIAVSEQARAAAAPFIRGEFEIVPNGVSLADGPADPSRRLDRIVFVGRHEPRKGLPVLLRAWASVHERTGARLRVVGTDPLAVRYLLRRLDLPDAGIDALGVLTTDERDAEIASAKVLAAPAIGGESFGMVLTEAFASGTPVVASAIDGYTEVTGADTGIMVEPGNEQALADGLVELLEDEPRRRALGSRARQVAEERYSWRRIAERLAEIYDSLAGAPIENAA
jgi:phosphatidylinositol alpha-mannosyltransferase